MFLLLLRVGERELRGEYSEGIGDGGEKIVETLRSSIFCCKILLELLL